MVTFAVIMGILAVVFIALAGLRVMRTSGGGSTVASAPRTLPGGLRPGDDTVLKKKLGNVLLLGRPDGMVKVDGAPTPVKRMSLAPGSKLTREDVAEAGRLELGTCALLMEDKRGQRPQKGIVMSAGQQHEVGISREDIDAVKKLVETIAWSKTTKKNIRRSHSKLEKCQRCEFYSGCEQRL